MRLFGPVTRVLLMPTLVRLLGLLALVEAVFLAESFQGLLEVTLRYDGSLWDVFHLLGYRAPEILDLALALGILVAVYFTVSDARNRGELIILATATVPWRHVIGFCLKLGAVGAIISLIVTAYLLPLARYHERITLEHLRNDHVTEQILATGPRQITQTFDGTTFIATPSVTTDKERGQLFVFSARPNGSWRAGVSQDWDIIAPQSGEIYSTILKDLRAYDRPTGTGSTKHIRAINTNSATIDFHMRDVAPPPDHSLRNNERPILLLEQAPDDHKRIAHAVGRALLAPAAAILALCAVVSAGAGVSRFISLPLALLAVMMLDVLGRSFLGNITNVPSLAIYALGALIYLLGPIGYVYWRGERLMVPVRGRA